MESWMGYKRGNLDNFEGGVMLSDKERKFQARLARTLLQQKRAAKEAALKKGGLCSAKSLTSYLHNVEMKLGQKNDPNLTRLSELKKKVRESKPQKIVVIKK